MDKLDINIEYIEQPQCKWQMCVCIKTMINNIKKQMEWNLNTHISKKLKETNDWWILFTGACGKANHIIWITINNIIDLCKNENLSDIDIIKKYNQEIMSKIKLFRESNQQDNYLQVLDKTRNKNIKRLDIKFIRWISNKDKNNINKKSLGMN